MAETQFRVKYVGPAVEDGRMNVRDLAPALLGLADAFQEANRVVNPLAADVSLDIRATDQGSFEVLMELQEAGVAVLAGTGVTAIANLKAVVLDPAKGLVARLRATQSPTAEEEENDDGSVTVRDGDTTITFPADVIRAGKSLTVRKGLHAATAPLGAEGITGLEVTISDSQPQPLFIRPSERQLFDPTEADITDTPPIFDSTGRTLLQVTQLSWKVGNAWRFRDANGTNLWARILDDDFNNTLTSRPQYPNAVLVCDMRTRIWRDDVGAMHPRHEITKVYDVRTAPPPPPEQGSIDLGG